jgi:hypothetical protein
MIHLDERTVRALLQWDPLIDAIEAALAAFSRGRVIQPVRTMIPAVSAAVARPARRGASSTTTPCGTCWSWTPARRCGRSPAT